MCFFFFRQKTAYEMRISDWSSDVCSSDLADYPGGARAVLFYGSCLRESELDGLMLDFYLIVSDYGDAYSKGWMAAANRLIPPNVFPFQHDGLIAKYAVLSEGDFDRLNGSETRNVSVWARFAQQIGRAPCGGGVCHEVEISVVAGLLKKKK